MKKTRLFKIPFSFDELDAEFNFLNADNDYCGMLLKLLKKYTDFFNLGLAGIPYKERYEILNARTRKEKAIADTIYLNNFYEVEGNDIFLTDFLVENDAKNNAKNDTKNAQKNVKKCIKNDAKIVKKNVKKIVKNDFIFDILFSIKNRSKMNQKNGKKGGRPLYENASKATNKATLEKNTTAKNQKPNGYDFAYENNAKNQSEIKRQNSRTVEHTVKSTYIYNGTTTNSQTNVEGAVVVEKNPEKNSTNSIAGNERGNSFFKDKISINQSFNAVDSQNVSNVVVDNNSDSNSIFDSENQNQNQNQNQIENANSNSNSISDSNEKINETFPRENENIFPNQIANLSESQITFNFFTKLKPNFRFHKPNELFHKTFQNGATLQDYRNAFSELSAEQQNSIKSINYLATIVDKSQQEASNIIPISSGNYGNYGNLNQIQINQDKQQKLIDSQIQLALTKRLNMIYYKLNKRREELKKVAVDYVYAHGVKMEKQAKIDFILQVLTPNEFELLKQENIIIDPDADIVNSTPLITYANF